MASLPGAKQTRLVRHIGRNSMTEKQPCYYLVCTAAGLNYGDDLIAAAWLRYLAEKQPGADITVDSVMPEVAQSTLGGIHPSTRFTDTLWMTCFDSPDPEPLAVSSFVNQAIGHPGRIPSRAADIERMARADVVHLVGGGFLNGLFQWTFGLPAGIVAATQRSGGRAVMTGQCFCPAPPEPVVKHLRELAEQFALVDVRDEASASLLGIDTVNLSVDDVFLSVGPGMYQHGAGAPQVMVCAHTDTTPGLTGRATVSELAEFVLKTLSHWEVKEEDVGFLECFPGLDHKVFESVKQRLPGARFYGLYEILGTGLPVAEGQCWISTRFHPHLVAAAAGMPGVALSVIPEYYDVKHRSLISQGSGWQLLSNLSVPSRPTRGGFPQDRLKSYAAEKHRIADLIYAAD